MSIAKPLPDLKVLKSFPEINGAFRGRILSFHKTERKELAVKKPLAAFALSILLASSLALPACSGGADSKEGSESSGSAQAAGANHLADASIDLNEQNRVQNYGDFLVDGDWYYGQGWDNNGSPTFVKARKDLSDWTTIDSGYAKYIYVVDGFIYYMLNDENSYGIYRAKASGQGERRLVKAFGSMQIVGDKIYYTDWMINGKYDSSGKTKKKGAYNLYRCDLNGKNVEKVLDRQVFFPYVFDTGIIYQDDDDNVSLHICDLNGENDVKLNDSRSFWPIYDGDFIYYVKEKKNKNGKYKRSIWKIKPDGTGDELVSDYGASSGFMLTENRIYFVNSNDGDRLYRMNKDGSELELVTQSPRIDYAVMLDDGIKYLTHTKGYEYVDKFYISGFDGSGKWEFERN